MSITCTNCGKELGDNSVFCDGCGTKVQRNQTQTKNDVLHEKHLDVIKEIEKVIKGKTDIITKVLMAMYASGNVLLEDTPGTGKTTLAKAISKAVSLDYKRQQFTPDTMPTDIVGYTYFEQGGGNIKHYREGVVFTNLLLADEINRTTAKTQSALLEAMEERTVTIDGETKPLPRPFFVIATQNPTTSMGTQPLPDSQCDRFIMKVSMGYPDAQNERQIIKERKLEDPTKSVEGVLTREELLKICTRIDELTTKDELLDYICALVNATRNHEDIEVGVSPRGTIAIKRMACAHAFVSKRNYVTPADVDAVFVDVCNHRILLNSQARMADKTERGVLENVLKTVPKPRLVD